MEFLGNNPCFLLHLHFHPPSLCGFLCFPQELCISRFSPPLFNPTLISHFCPFQSPHIWCPSFIIWVGKDVNWLAGNSRASCWGWIRGNWLFFCLHSEELIEKLFNYRGISFLLLIRYSDTNNIPPLWNEIMRNSKLLSQKRLQKWNLSWKTLESMPASEEWKEIDKNSYQGLLYYLFTLTRDYLDTGKNWCRWIRLKNPSLMQIIKQDI